MKALRFIDGSTTFVVILHQCHDNYIQRNDWELHSCWRFLPGRISAVPTALSTLPWTARQEVALLLNNPMP